MRLAVMFRALTSVSQRTRLPVTVLADNSIILLNFSALASKFMSVLHENILIGQSIIVTTTIGQNNAESGNAYHALFSKSLYINPFEAKTAFWCFGSYLGDTESI